LWCTFHRPELVRVCLEQSLKKLQLAYVDLYLIHFPTSLKPGDNYFPTDENGRVIFDTVDLCATWEAMEKCKDAGLARSIGVSNFNRRQLEMILNKPGLKYKPVCNQVECHPYLNQKKNCWISASQKTLFWLLTVLWEVRVNQNGWTRISPILLDDPVLGSLAKKYKQTPALIALRYQIQRGVVVLAKSFNEKRIKENMQVFEFQLTTEDMKVLDGLNKKIRNISGS
ncbi:estradiol 17 beta-dehydrogenase 5 isoform X1, partial [Sigmodon hispidus]